MLRKVIFHLELRSIVSYILLEQYPFKIWSAKHLYWSFQMFKMNISRPQPQRSWLGSFGLGQWGGVRNSRIYRNLHKRVFKNFRWIKKLILVKGMKWLTLYPAPNTSQSSKDDYPLLFLFICTSYAFERFNFWVTGFI